MAKDSKELTAFEATRRLGITVDATYRLIYAGRLPARKDAAGKWCVSEAAVDQRLEERERRRAAAEEAVA